MYTIFLLKYLSKTIWCLTLGLWSGAGLSGDYGSALKKISGPDQENQYPEQILKKNKIRFRPAS